MPYHSIKSKMWGSRNGTYRKILRIYGDATAIVASYLMSNPHARQSGIYSCPISYIASETERSAAQVKKCLKNLEEIHFSEYDFEEEVVWVYTMVSYQVNPQWTDLRRNVTSKRDQDNRYQGILNSLEDVEHSYLHAEFCKRWELARDEVVGCIDVMSYQTDHKEALQGASKGHTRGFDTEGSRRAPKGLHGDDS